MTDCIYPDYDAEKEERDLEAKYEAYDNREK